jgi:hypothetical protein
VCGSDDGQHRSAQVPFEGTLANYFPALRIGCCTYNRTVEPKRRRNLSLSRPLGITLIASGEIIGGGALEILGSATALYPPKGEVHLPPSLVSTPVLILGAVAMLGGCTLLLRMRAGKVITQAIAVLLVLSALVIVMTIGGGNAVQLGASALTLLPLVLLGILLMSYMRTPAAKGYFGGGQLKEVVAEK